MKPTKENKQTTTVEVPAEDVAVVDKIEKDDAVVAGQSGDEPVTVVMKAPKKHKIGIVIGIVVFLLLLISGASVLVWYFCIYNNPEVVAYDAVRQLISAEHVMTNGIVKIASSEADENGNKTVAELQFTTSSKNLPNNTSVTLNVSERDRNDEVVDNHDISLSLGWAVLSDGTLYLQTRNLIETFDQALAAEEKKVEDLDEMEQFAYAVIELIDNEWWQISLGDILGELDFSRAMASPISDFYSCVLDAATDYDGIAKLYDAHRFVGITKDEKSAATPGATRYQVELHYDVLADFVNGLPETPGAEKALTCYNNFASDYGFAHFQKTDIPEVSASDLEKLLPGDHDLYLEITNFGHELRRLEVDSIIGGVDVNSDLTFSYTEVAFSEPVTYRPITDLLEDLYQLFGEYFYGLGSFEADANKTVLI